MREVVVFSVLLVLLVLMMRSVSASAPATPEVSRVTVAMRPIEWQPQVILPPQARSGMSKRAVTVEDPGDVGGGTTTNPKLNRAGVAAKRAVAINDVITEPPTIPAVQKVREA